VVTDVKVIHLGTLVGVLHGRNDQSKKQAKNQASTITYRYIWIIFLCERNFPISAAVSRAIDAEIVKKVDTSAGRRRCRPLAAAFWPSRQAEGSRAGVCQLCVM